MTTAADRFAAADAQAAQEEEVLSVDDLYDSEKIAVSEVYAALSQNINRHRELGSFQREVRERFAAIGFEARCDLYESEHEDHLPKSERTSYPSITLVRRIEKVGEFDHDQMRHEVRSNLLGLNPQGSVQKVQVGQTGFGRTKSGLIVPD